MKRILFSFALAGAMAAVGATGAMAEGRGADNRTDPRDVASDRGFGMGGNPGQGVRTRTGHSLDASNARSHAAFMRDLEDTDIAGTVHVRTAAQFDREITKAQYANLVAVFFTEERHCA